MQLQIIIVIVAAAVVVFAKPPAEIDIQITATIIQSSIENNKIKPTNFTFAAALLYQNKFACGGSIISETCVLFQARTCSPLYEDEKDLKIIAGSNIIRNTTAVDYVYDVADIFVEFDYQEVGIVKVARHFRFSDSLQKVQFSWQLPAGGEIPFTVLDFFLIGWHTNDYSQWAVVRHDAIHIQHPETCERILDYSYNRNRSYCINVSKSPFCRGDPGHGLFVADENHHIIQIGTLFYESPECNVVVYTNLYNNLWWINETLETYT